MEVITRNSQSASADRFIPSRNAMDIENSHYNIMTDVKSDVTEYQSTLSEAVFPQAESQILAYKPRPPVVKSAAPGPHRVLYSQNITKSSAVAKKSCSRVIPQTSERVLDAPGLVDDYYLNLLDWSSQNVLAVALSNCVYLWNGTTGVSEALVELEGEDDYVTSVSWVADGSYLAVGTNKAEIQLWDVEQAKPLRKMRGHSARVSSMSWNQHILSSGSKDTSIIHNDVRVASHIAARLCGHQQEVCGLQWSSDGLQLASGGNDNILNIWDGFSTQAKFSLGQHQAAVKAVSWCPWQSDLLATGGGTADRSLKFWNTSTGVCLNSIDTQSQVCAIQWNKHHREVITSHGYSQNQLSVWKYPSLAKVGDMCGHSARVLHLATSPDGETIVSAGADETLRFWKIVDSADKLRSNTSSVSSLKPKSNLSVRMNLR